jgi:1-deoxy-D-xylulose 5-phosphate reductoisomerase
VPTPDDGARLSAAVGRFDASGGPVVDHLQEEHAVIHEIIERVDKALVAFVGTPDGAAPLREAVDLLTDTLHPHFSYEKRELIEPIARLS